MKTDGKVVVVVGGGAAGFFGALACAEAHPHTKVIVLEKGHKPLAKVRISGGGRCNVTHACFDPKLLVKGYPRGARALLGPFSRFQAKDTVSWFESRGVALKTEADGRMFPVTDSSETIIDCLLESAESLGIELRTQCGVSRIQRVETDASHADISTHSAFEVYTNTGEVISCDQVLLAGGGSPGVFELARSLGHTIIPPVPSLFTFQVEDPRIEGLLGISVPQAKVTLPAFGLEQTGPLLITHWGLSGPAVLKLSAWGARALHDCRYQTPLQIRWVAEPHEDAVRARLLSLKGEHARRKISGDSAFDLPARLWESLVTAAGIPEPLRWADLSKQALHALVQELFRGSYAVTGKGVFKEEFVTCGGVALDEVQFKTLESKKCPGLFLAGEVLDIDGITGGFNFQSAWTTGYLAGLAME